MGKLAVEATQSQIVGQDPQGVDKLLSHWAQVLSTGQLDRLLELYAPGSILIPTFNDRLHFDSDDREQYFLQLMSLEGLRVTVVEQHPRRRGDIAFNSGIYEFRFIRDGHEQWFLARFSFVYEETDIGWKILEHHSSVLPETFMTAKPATASAN